MLEEELLEAWLRLTCVIDNQRLAAAHTMPERLPFNEALVCGLLARAREEGVCLTAGELCRRTQEISKRYEGCQVNICLNYGGRDELVRAARAFAQDCIDGKADPNHLTVDRFGG